MARMVPFIVIVVLVAGSGGQALAQSIESGAGLAAAGRHAVAAIAEHPSEARLQPWRPPIPRRSPRPRSRARALLIGTAIGATAGAIVVYAQYREGGAEAAWLGAYGGGIMGATWGLMASQ